MWEGGERRPEKGQDLDLVQLDIPGQDVGLFLELTGELFLTFKLRNQSSSV